MAVQTTRALTARARAATVAVRSRAAHLLDWSQTSAGKRFCALLAVALLLRLLLAPVRGFGGDLQAFVNWGILFDRHPLHVYSSPTPVAYPPLTIYFFGVVVGAYALARHVLLGPPAPSFLLEQSSAFIAFVRLPLIAIDLGTVIVMYAVGRHFASERRALLLAALYAFAPAILLDGTLWGQMDGLMVLLTLIALLLVAQQRVVWGGVVFGLNLMVKPQPVCFLPLILIFLLRWVGWRAVVRFLGALVGACDVICLPYLLPPHPQLLVFLHTLRATTDFSSSADADNLWWLLGLGHYPASRPLLGPLTPSLLGWLLFSMVVAVVAYGTVRSASRQRYFFGAGLLALAFFDLTTYQHERYIIPALSLFLLVGCFSWLGIVVSVVAGATMFLNHATFIVLYANPVVDVRNLAAFLRQHPEMSAIFSAVNIFLLIEVFALYIYTISRQREARPQAGRWASPTSLWLRTRASPHPSGSGQSLDPASAP
jgi:hypothetical protein